MRLRLAALATALIAPLLAGCLEEAATPGRADGGTSPQVVTRPDDFEALDNMSTDDRPHLHDYWGGKETLRVMDATEPEGVMLFGDWYAHTFRPDAKRVVPQGASEVAVTFTWTDEPDDAFTGPELWVKTAADREAKFVADVAKGETIRFPTTNPENDLPHNVISAWELEFRIFPPEDGVRPIVKSGEIAIVVDATRGLDIPLFPAHPDRWESATEIQLLDDASDPIVIEEGHSIDGYRCYTGCIDRHVPRDGIVVPFDAESVEVTLTHAAQSPSRLGLAWHGADTWEWTVRAPDADDGTTKTWTIPLARGMGDGPYAAQSVWEFVPMLIDGAPDAGEGVFVGAYSITARALKGPETGGEAAGAVRTQTGAVLSALGEKDVAR